MRALGRPALLAALVLLVWAAAAPRADDHTVLQPYVGVTLSPTSASPSAKAC